MDVQLLECHVLADVQHREELHPYREPESFDLAGALGSVRSCVDKIYLKSCAAEGKALVPEAATIVNHDFFRQAAILEAGPQHIQERFGGLRGVEAPRDHQPRGIIDQADQLGGDPLAVVQNLRPVHHVGVQQVKHPLGLEAAHILARLRVEHRSLLSEERIDAAHGDGVRAGEDAQALGPLHQRRQRDVRVLQAQLQQPVGGLSGDLAPPALVAAALGNQRGDVAFLDVGLVPAPDRRLADRRLARARDGVLAPARLLDEPGELTLAQPIVQERVDHLEAKQCFLFICRHSVLLSRYGTAYPANNGIATLNRWCSEGLRSLGGYSSSRS